MVRNFSDKERIEEMCVQCSSGRCEFPIVGVFFPRQIIFGYINTEEKYNKI